MKTNRKRNEMFGMKFTNAKDLGFDFCKGNIVDAWFASNTPDNVVKILETVCGDFDLIIGREKFAPFSTFEAAKRHAERTVVFQNTVGSAQ